MENETGLLETLWALVGCPYLSDLRAPLYRIEVRQAVVKLRPEDFPPHEWKEALSYLIV